MIELLAVLLIMGMLLGLAATVVKSGGTAQKRIEGARQFIGAMQQARAEAITLGDRTALVMAGPNAQLGEDSGKLYGIFKLLDQPDSPGIEQVGRWQRLPEGVVFADFEIDGQPNGLTQLDQQFEVIIPGRGVASLPAIVFGPRGEVVSPPSGQALAFGVANGALRNGSIVYTARDASGEVNFERVVVRRATGRARRIE